MSLYICIHGHFYQPPRENPWLEEIEIQSTAAPYGNWNEKVTAECYAPNGAARILDGSGMITGIRNNYSRMSFNFGPTLLSWMEKHDPAAYGNILEADEEGRARFSGHGPAIAQAYNHIIMPLASDRDKRTQVLWGIADFRRRFRRFPEGMWLPETAVDLATLEFLAGEGITFTILSPFQALRARNTGNRTWRNAGGGKIDPYEPYLCRLPSGRSITVFFYHGGLARDVAFGNLLDDGGKFASGLLSSEKVRPGEDKLVSVATDGETYGHHHKYGDMALAYCLDTIERTSGAELTVYGEYLERHPARMEVEVVENSSWSCAHGVGRWKSDCGCSTGMNPGWNQAWRDPLREGLDTLRDSMEPVFTDILDEKIADPWKARDDYISVVLDRTPDNIEKFLSSRCLGKFPENEKIDILKALEMERASMLMFTSCGWFFDDISGIETLQILRYAAHAVQYAGELTGGNFEPLLTKFLEKAESNIPDLGTGADIYGKYVKPYVFSLPMVGVNYGILSLFSGNDEEIPTYCYSVKQREEFSLGAGNTKLCSGCLDISSGITLENCRVWYASLGLGGHNVVCSLSGNMNPEIFESFKADMDSSFSKGNISGLPRIIRKYFDGYEYDLGYLFGNERQRILSDIISEDSTRLENMLREIIEDDYLIMNFMSSVRMPVPFQFLKAADVVLNCDIIKEFDREYPDPRYIGDLLGTAGRWKVPLDKDAIGLAVSRWVDSRMEYITGNIEDSAAVETVADILGIILDGGMKPDLWSGQNRFFGIMADLHARKGGEKKLDKTLPAGFERLGALLGVGTSF